MVFLAGALGDPINSKVRLRQQAARWNTADKEATARLWRDICTGGVDAKVSRELVDALKIVAGGAPASKIPGKQSVPAFTIDLGDVDPNNWANLHLLANLFGKYENADQGGDYRELTFGLNALTTADRHFEMQLDSDVIPRTHLLDARVGTIEVSAGPNANYQMTFGGLAGSFNFFDDVVTQETGGDDSSNPTFLGALDDTWVVGNADRIYVEVQSVVAGVSALCKATVASALPAFAGTNTFTVVFGGAPTRMIEDSDGTPIGNQSRPVMMTWPAVPFATPVALDVYFSPIIKAATWAQSLPASRVIGSVHTASYVNTNEIPLEGGWSISGAWDTFELVDDMSKEYLSTVKRSGRFPVEVTLTRELVDLILQQPLHQAAENTISAVFEAKTNVALFAGPPVVPYKICHIFPSLKPIGEGYGVEPGGTNTVEVVTFQAEVPAGPFTWPVGGAVTYASHYHVYIETENTFATF